jgi:heme exporter protein B
VKSFFSQVLTLAGKDLRIELRRKEILFSMVLFVALTLLIFHFSFGSNPAAVAETAPGILWVVIAFAGLIALSHLAQREDEDRVYEGLQLTACGGPALFFAKYVSAVILLTGIQLVAVPLFMVFFNFSPGDWSLSLTSVLALGTLGYAAVGTLFACLLSHTRLSALFLPVVFYPVIVPLFVAAVKATSVCLKGDFPARELAAMAGFDLIFVAACALLFDFAWEERP